MIRWIAVDAPNPNARFRRGPEGAAGLAAPDPARKPLPGFPDHPLLLFGIQNQVGRRPNPAGAQPQTPFLEGFPSGTIQPPPNSPAAWPRLCRRGPAFLRGWRVGAPGL